MIEFWNLLRSKALILFHSITGEKTETVLSTGIKWLFVLLALFIVGAVSVVYFYLRNKGQNQISISARMSGSEAALDIQEDDAHTNK